MMIPTESTTTNTWLWVIYNEQLIADQGHNGGTASGGNGRQDNNLLRFGMGGIWAKMDHWQSAVQTLKKMEPHSWGEKQWHVFHLSYFSLAIYYFADRWRHLWSFRLMFGVNKVCTSSKFKLNINPERRGLMCASVWTRIWGKSMGKGTETTLYKEQSRFEGWEGRWEKGWPRLRLTAWVNSLGWVESSLWLNSDFWQFV